MEDEDLVEEQGRDLTPGAQRSSGIFFRPWEGATYGSGDVRLLVLGESHHGTGPKPDWTVEVVKRYIANEPGERESWFRTFTNIARVVTGRRYWEIKRSEFWNSIAFYNYAQEVVADAARGARPSPEMFRRSRSGFRNVLSTLRPTHILALGVWLWRNMEDCDGHDSDLSCDGKSSECRWYMSGDCSHRALAIGIKHPAAGFSAKAWHPLVAKFLSARH